ncbi:MAG TPA: restriction endonuclease, partial [Algoriphagus sp.]
MKIENWSFAKLDQISSKITDGSHNPPPKMEIGLPMLSATNILNGEIIFDKIRLIDPLKFEGEYKRANVEPNDVLLTIVGTIGRSTVVPLNIEKFTLQRSVALIKPLGVNPKYLSFTLRSPNIQKIFDANSKGTAQKGIYLGTLKKIEIPFPPLPEQRAIVARIEELLS